MRNVRTTFEKNRLLSRSSGAGFTPKHAGLTLGLVLAYIGACVVEDEEPLWVGGELWELEQVPDETPSLLDESALEDVLGDEVVAFDGATDLTAEIDVQQSGTWTGWYDRDDPDYTGDVELRHLQSGVCSQPTGVECRTTGGLPLWETGEVVSCSVDGLLCLNSDQPDNKCDHDYMVRFLCPGGGGGGLCGDGICNEAGGESHNNCPADCDCPTTPCSSSACGYVSDGCGGTRWCGACLDGSISCGCGGPECWCTASASGGCGGYSYGWNYSGQGTLYPYGSIAEIMFNNGCNPDYFHTVSVTVTDSCGNTDQPWVEISPGCGGGPPW